jgi:hypothetical protein
MIALENNPTDRGETKWQAVDVAPALCPNSVTYDTLTFKSNYLIRVSTKCSDIILNKSKGLSLIMKTVISIVIFCNKKSQGSQPVRDCDYNNFAGICNITSLFNQINPFVEYII